MKLLVNRRAWLRWKKVAIGFQEGVTAPKEYPCYAYTSVKSFGYEEYRENYLYLKDVQDMHKKISSEAQQEHRDGCLCLECDTHHMGDGNLG